MASSSSKQSLALLLAAVLAAAAAAPPASALGGVPPCGRFRKITVQNLCGRDLPLTLTPVAGSPQPFGPGFELRHGTHESFSVCSWSGRISAAGAPPADIHLGADGGAWYKAGFTQLEPVHVEVTPHADPAHGGGRLEGHCPTVGCGAGHGRCSREDEAGRDCHNVDELKIIYYKH